MKKLFLTLAVASAVVTANAATRVLYEQNFETVGTPEEAGWSIAGGTMSIASDDFGKFLELALGQNNGRSAQVTWGQDVFMKDGVSVLEDGTYDLQFDFSLQNGSTNQYNSCFTVFTNHTPLASQPYRNPWSPVGCWENYLFDMSQVNGEQFQFAVNGKTTKTVGDDGTVTYGIDYTTPTTFNQGAWYTVKLNVNVNTRQVEYSVEGLDGTIATSGTMTVPEADVNGEPITMYAEGLFVMLARYQSTYLIDNIRISYESANDFANAPTMALTRVGQTADEQLNLNMRAYTITFLDGETLHVQGTDGKTVEVEWADCDGAYVYETTTSGTLKAWTTSGTATSDVVEATVDCNPIVLPQATATISSVSAGFAKTYTLNVSNTDVALRPTISMSYVFTGKSGKIIEADEQYSGATVAVDEEGTLKITTSAFGYQENTVEIKNDLEFEVKKAYDFAHMTQEEISAAGFPAFTVLNSATTSGFNNWTARKRLYYNLAGSEVTGDDGSVTYTAVYPFGFLAEDNTVNVINYSVIDQSAAEAPVALFEGLTIFPDKGRLSAGLPNVGMMYRIGLFNDQTNNTNNNIIVNGLDQSDFVVVNFINNYGGNSNHPVCATDDEYFAQLAGDDAVYSVAQSGTLDEATGTYSVTHALYRVDTACTKITVFKQKGGAGVDDILADEAENTDEAYYTITGLRLDKPTTPGFYIHKGKKILVK